LCDMVDYRFPRSGLPVSVHPEEEEEGKELHAMPVGSTVLLCQLKRLRFPALLWFYSSDSCRCLPVSRPVDALYSDQFAFIFRSSDFGHSYRYPTVTDSRSPVLFHSVSDNPGKFPGRFMLTPLSACLLPAHAASPGRWLSPLPDLPYHLPTLTGLHIYLPVLPRGYALPVHSTTLLPPLLDAPPPDERKRKEKRKGAPEWFAPRATL